MNLISRTIQTRQGPLFLALSLTLAATGFGQTLLNSWEGMRAPSPTDWVPPDPHGAPGPVGIIATVNLRISYFSKAGPPFWGPAELSSFWSSVTNSGAGLSDPKVVFDHDSRRFF